MAIMNFNYTQAINQANQIATVASDMLNVANSELQTTLDSIGVCWQGEASRQFVGYCAATQTDIRTQAQSLQSLASRLRDVAKIIKDAEEEALRLQQKQAARGPAPSSIAPLSIAPTSPPKSPKLPGPPKLPGGGGKK